MQLNITTDYAVRIMVHLLRKERGAIVRAEEISETTKIPFNYVQRVASFLKSGGYLETVRGQRGGYRLLAAAYDMTIYDVVQLYEPEKIHKSLEGIDEEADETTFCMFCEVLQGLLDSNMKKLTLVQLADAEAKGDMTKLLGQIA